MGQQEVLSLSNNWISGTIPAEMGKISQLKYLFLEYNSISGTVPAAIGELSQLEYLYLGPNNMKGDIPEFPEDSQLAHFSPPQRWLWLQWRGREQARRTRAR